MSEMMKTAVSGMNSSVTRIVAAVSNIVNASSTGRLPETPGGKATCYQPVDVVTLSDSTGDNTLGVHTEIIPRVPSYRVAPDPQSPHANAAGLIAEPNVDIVAELMNVKMAEVVYRANAAVIKTADKTEKTLLDTLA